MSVHYEPMAILNYLISAIDPQIIYKHYFINNKATKMATPKRLHYYSKISYFYPYFWVIWAYVHLFTGLH